MTRRVRPLQIRAGEAGPPVVSAADVPAPLSSFSLKHRRGLGGLHPTQKPKPVPHRPQPGPCGSNQCHLRKSCKSDRAFGQDDPVSLKTKEKFSGTKTKINGLNGCEFTGFSKVPRSKNSF